MKILGHENLTRMVKMIDMKVYDITHNVRAIEMYATREKATTCFELIVVVTQTTVK